MVSAGGPKIILKSHYIPGKYSFFPLYHTTLEISYYGNSPIIFCTSPYGTKFEDILSIYLGMYTYIVENRLLNDKYNWFAKSIFHTILFSKVSLFEIFYCVAVFTI